jgi:hypothetical protein
LENEPVVSEVYEKIYDNNFKQLLEHDLARLRIKERD